ncbi:hypothetical protein [Fastidiosibacter lacustris]|uniref:hypothetical protein n=1 Tax=Fastidiosibacter lacustris TaxID=2056695 RepID=UPI000E344EE6|nr:hypothetical protein [Fastidiosibacter lacustris]
MLELCAGPARHSLALYTIKNDPKAIACIDSSQAMHDYAINKVGISECIFLLFLQLQQKN